MYLLRTIIIFSLVANLNSCLHREKSVQQAVQTPSPTKIFYEDSLLLVRIFGNAQRSADVGCCNNSNEFYGKITLDSTHFTTAHWIKLDLHMNRREFEYFIEYKWEIEVDNKKKLLVVLAADGISCHACPGVVGAAILTRADDDKQSKQTGYEPFTETNYPWNLERFENDVVVMGTTGYPVDGVDVQACGDEAYGIILKKGSTWSGVNVCDFRVAVFRKGVFYDALEKGVPFSRDNWSNAEGDEITNPFSYTSFVSFVPDKNSEIDAISVHYQGTRLDATPFRKPYLFDKVIQFNYDNGKFTTKDQLPQD